MVEPGLRVGVAYGGRSVEHDVSVITALQAMEVLAERHRPVPIYISRDGRWYSDQSLLELGAHGVEGGEPAAARVALEVGADGAELVEQRRGRFGRAPRHHELDVVLPAAHGTYGEDGSLQGLLELAGLPYAGSGVGASAAAMDKGLAKAALREAGLPVLPHVLVHRESWDREGAAALRGATDELEGPVYVKPLSLGSSIGVQRCAGMREVEEALELAFELDRAALVEPSVERATEVNCAVLGASVGELRASVCEQPVKQGEILSFEDKYMSDGKGGARKGEGMAGADRIIPAPIGDERTAEVQDLARLTFRALGCAGVARVDFLVNEAGNVYVNECNTVPGSFSFYLWEPAGLAFPALLEELLDIAFRERDEARRTTRTFASNLLAARGVQGAKA